jgi:hypothetical protein
MPRKLRIPGRAETAEINRGIASDADAYVPSDAEWARAKPLAAIDPALAAEGRRSGPARQYHVVPRGEGWAVRRIGLRVTELFDNKLDAVAHARAMAEASGTEWVEYRRDGTVRDIHRPADREHSLPVAR